MNDSENTVLGYESGEVGLVDFHDFRSDAPFEFELGGAIEGFVLRYETYGKLNAAKDNAILICHALSGDHHCAGVSVYTNAKRAGGILWWPGEAHRYLTLFCDLLQCIGRMPRLNRPGLGGSDHRAALSFEFSQVNGARYGTCASLAGGRIGD